MNKHAAKSAPGRKARRPRGRASGWDAFRSTLTGMGLHHASLDGLRFDLPIALRSRFAADLDVGAPWKVSIWSAGHLRVVPVRHWEPYLDFVRGELQGRLTEEQLQELVVQPAMDVKADSKLRWNLPKTLADSIGIGTASNNSITLAPGAAWIEIWDRKTKEGRLRQAMEKVGCLKIAPETPRRTPVNPNDGKPRPGNCAQNPNFETTT